MMILVSGLSPHVTGLTFGGQQDQDPQTKLPSLRPSWTKELLSRKWAS